MPAWKSIAADCPVCEGVRVEQLVSVEDGFALRTSNGQLQSRTVVVATGDENVARIPALSQAFPPNIRQFHAADYRNPDQLPDGGVLVVGSAQTGCQITEELLAAGRRVILATSAVGRAPTPYRGRDTAEWLFDAGFFDQRPQDLPDPAMMPTTGADPGPPRAKPEPATAGPDGGHAGWTAGCRRR